MSLKSEWTTITFITIVTIIVTLHHKTTKKSPDMDF